MKTDLKLGFIKHNKKQNKIILLFSKKDEYVLNEVMLVDMKNAPISDDFELVSSLYKQFKQGEARVEEYLKGYSYGLKSVLEGETITFAVEEEAHKTHIILPPLKNEIERPTKTYAVIDPFATLGNALLDFNVKRRQEEITGINDTENSR
jgi:hypothetical protein